MGLRESDRLDRVGLVVVVGFALAIAVVAVADRSGDAVEAPRPADELVDAWSRSRTVTHRSQGTFEREAPDGRRLAAPTEVVQRPPDRLIRGFDEVSGRRGDRELSCPAPLAGDDGLDCRLGPPGRSFDAVVAEEVESFRSLVDGDEPLYEVRRADPGCWTMTRTRYDPRFGYGVEATLCFDPSIGVLRSVTIDHGEIVETTTYHDITTDVTDADLEP